MRTKTILSICILLTLFQNSLYSTTEETSTDGPVNIPDPNLKAAIETKLGISDPNESEMSRITIFSAYRKGINNLTGLEYATNLKQLWLEENQIEDTSPIYNLINLQLLHLDGNRINDISSLSGLVNLKDLQLNSNQISDISSLAGLNNLEILKLYRNQISDISPLSGILNLEQLYLNENQINDISSLSGLVNLKDLQLNSNQISDISSLAGLNNLEILKLYRNQISDIPSLSGLINLKQLYLNENKISDITVLSELTTLTGLFLYRNQINDISPLAGLTNLKTLYVHENQISDISALSDLTNLISLHVQENKISDISALSGLTNLKTLYAHQNQIIDILALSELINLTDLWLNSNQIDDISALSGLINLEELWLHRNQIDDISALSELINLEELWLDRNQIDDISALSGLKEIRSLHLSNNQISDISPLSELTGMKYLHLYSNPLNVNAYNIYIPLLKSYGTNVYYSPLLWRTLTLSSTIGGSVIEPGEGNFDYTNYTIVDINAVAEPGYDFIAWTGTAVYYGKVADPNSPNTTVIMDSNYTLVADFWDENVIYVDDDANGSNDGTSWNNAYNYLQDALADAKTAPKANEIRVAQGTYYPDRGAGRTRGDREATFQASTINLIGGYAGNGHPNPDERDIELYETILSGDLNCDDAEINNTSLLLYEPSRADNSFSVIGTFSTGTIDGFTITAGNANYPPPVYEWFSDHRREGGGIYNNLGSPHIINCIFKRNSARKGGGLFNNNQSDGFSEWPHYNKPQIINCKFIENMAESGGGGIYNKYGNPTLNNCTFNGNVSAGSGGGIYNYYNSYFRSWDWPDYNSPVLVDCTFNWNVAESYGGGIYNFDNNVELTNCTFNLNMALNQGGGIYNYSSESTITNCSFNFNIAKSYGGGIYNSTYSNTLVENCIFNVNMSVSGGGMSNNQSSPIITHCTFTGNNAEYNGGGIHNSESNPQITNCIFKGNNTDFLGGGIYNTSNSNTILEKSIFNNNYAKANGGGIYNSSSNATLTQCIFSGNSSSFLGGRLYSIEQSQLFICNCIFTGNSSLYGNAVACSTANNHNIHNIIELTNSIIWDSMDKIRNSSDSIFNISYCDTKDGQASVYDPNETINWGEGNINIDPCFVEPGYWDTNNTPNDSNDDFWVDGDYHLKSNAGRFDPNSKNWIQDDETSPCIDAGDPNSPVYYEIFPNGGRINMGAFGGTTEASMSLNDTIILEQASSPNPPNNAVEIVLDIIPGWISDLDTIIHEIYFGKTGLPQFIQKQYDMTYNPGTLEPNTQYFWRVDSIDDFQNRTTGNTWTFRTGFYPAHIFYLSPSNGAIDEEVKTELRWFHGLNSITYNVYFGTSFNDVNNATIANPLDVLVAENQEPNSYNPGTLEYGQVYFWRIDETDSSGITTKGDVWSFITMSQPPKSRGCFTDNTPAWINGNTIEISKVKAGQNINQMSHVEELQVHEGIYDLFDIVLESGDCITVADEHYFMLKSGKWISSKNLKSGMKLKTSNGSIEIQSITKHGKRFSGKVYNLKIQGSNQYMVGLDAVIVRDF